MTKSKLKLGEGTEPEALLFGAEQFMKTPDKADPWKSSKPRCYESHPDFEIAPGLIIHGGSCAWPKHKNDDVYLGFDGSMTQTERSYPWTEGDEMYYRWPDGAAPPDVPVFKKMVEWTAEQLKAGRSVHAGCIGGHGRTGTFFAALRKVLVPDDPDPIAFVRANYCSKTIESQKQVDFLMKEYGAKSAQPSKHGYVSTPPKIVGTAGYSKPSKAAAKSFSSGRVNTGPPMNRPTSIWGGALN